MKYNIGDIVKITAPKSASTTSLARDGWCGTIIDYKDNSACYEVQFQDKSTDWYFESWLSCISSSKTNWTEIKEIAEMALTHNKDIIITINADGSKEIEISTPTTSIVESSMRTKYIPDGIEGVEQ